MALPPLLGSLLCAGRAANSPPLDGPTFAALGLAVLAGGGLLAGLALRLGWPGGRAAANTVATLGLLAPALALALLLNARALRDPRSSVLMPAALGLILFALALLLCFGLALALRPAPARLGPALLPGAAAAVWLSPLAAGGEERSLWAALALTLALTATAWFATGLLTGWPAHAPASLALAWVWAAALSLPRHPDGGLLAAVHLALAAAATGVALLLPPALRWWRRRAAGGGDRPPTESSSPPAGPIRGAETDA
jgi:hypothetical protein